LALTFDGTNYVVAWSDSDPQNVVYAARVTSAGTVLDPGGIVLDMPPELEPATDLAVASRGGVTTVFWQVWSEDEDFSPLRAVRLNSNGVPLDADPLNVGTGRDLAVASDGAEALLISVDGPFPYYGIIHADLH